MTTTKLTPRRHHARHHRRRHPSTNSSNQLLRPTHNTFRRSPQNRLQRHLNMRLTRPLKRFITFSTRTRTITGPINHSRPNPRHLRNLPQANRKTFRVRRNNHRPRRNEIAMLTIRRTHRHPRTRHRTTQTTRSNIHQEHISHRSTIRTNLRQTTLTIPNANRIRHRTPNLRRTNRHRHTNFSTRQDPPWITSITSVATPPERSSPQ